MKCSSPSVALLWLAGSALGAQATPSPALLALSKTDLTLAIVNPATLAVVARMPSGPDPHEVVASADGRFAYIANYGGGAYNTLTVVDLVNQKTLEAVDLGALRGPHGLTFVGGKVWFTAEAAKVIGSYDPATRKVDLVLGTGQNRTHMIWVSSDGRRIVTSDVNAATISVIDKLVAPIGPVGAGVADWQESHIPVGRGAEGFDVTPDLKEIWVANAGDGTISIIDAGTKKVAQTLDANVVGANRLKITPDGKRALVSSLRLPDLVIFDVASRREVRRVKVGRGAAGIEIQPDGVRAYVACTPDDYVVVIDLKSMEVLSRIDAGKQPDGLAWAVRR
jgi:YVTN family beta-propeller protein